MIELALTTIAVSAFVYALIAQRLSESVITGPMLAIGLGLLMASYLGREGAHLEGMLHLIAEITLVLVLFSDAAMLRVRNLRKNAVVPARM